MQKQAASRVFSLNVEAGQTSDTEAPNKLTCVIVALVVRSVNHSGLIA